MGQTGKIPVLRDLADGLLVGEETLEKKGTVGVKHSGVKLSKKAEGLISECFTLPSRLALCKSLYIKNQNIKCGGGAKHSDINIFALYLHLSPECFAPTNLANGLSKITLQ